MEEIKMYHRFWFFNLKTWIFETKDIQTFNLWLENDTNSFLSVEYLTETKFKCSSTCESLPMFSIHQNVPCLHYSSSTTSLLHWSTKEPSSSFGPESTHYRTSKYNLVLLRIKMSLADEEEVNSNWGSQYLMMMKVHILIIMLPRMLFRKALTVASWQLTALELPLIFGRRWELACWQPVIVVYAVYAAKAHNSLVCFAFGNVLIKNALRFDVNVRPLSPTPPLPIKRPFQVGERAHQPFNC